MKRRNLWRAFERHGWIGMLSHGLAEILIGLLALFNPLLTGVSIGIMLGLTLFIYGGIVIVAAFAHRRIDWLEGLRGLIAAILGSLILGTPSSAVATLVWLTGAWLIAAGIFSLIGSSHALPGRTWMLLTGLMNVLLGSFLLLIDPVSALAYAGIILSVSLVSRGIFLMIAATKLRGAQR